ncbi:uncharacterized protein LOC34621371 [Cyclospora cayetanensis]|uniref:Uncharacterized protein LOC34621371 n=2 Tax=Cyclospora cayetanensis TaxID=88456 RepID=A0A6P5WFS3_9EIME|nr:uncharacterized protein LOC34621371 [Cyclospora cayetanensis]OEH78303.1 hypothetical protein cyc_04918 [Cyclospora cayetanensis]
MTEPARAREGKNPSNEAEEPRRVPSSGHPKAKEEQESSSCGGTTSAESPREATLGEYNLGACSGMPADGWAEALSVAIPMEVCDVEKSDEQKKEADTGGHSWLPSADSMLAHSSSHRAPVNGKLCRSTSSTSGCYPSEPGPKSMARRAAAAAVAANSCRGDDPTPSRLPHRSGLDRTAKGVAAGYKQASSTCGISTKHEGEGGRELRDTDLTTEESDETSGSVHSFKDGDETYERLRKSRAERRKSTDQDTDEGPGSNEESYGTQLETPSRGLGKRSIKRPARYEDWLAENEDEHASPAVPPARMPHQKRCRGGTFPVPRVVKRKEEPVETCPATSETPVPRPNARGSAITTRKRRLMPWLDMAAVEAVAANCVAKPLPDSDRAIATGVAAAAAAAAAVAATTAVTFTPVSARVLSGRGASASDGIQGIFDRALNTLRRIPQSEGQPSSETAPSSAAPTSHGQKRATCEVTSFHESHIDNTASSAVHADWDAHSSCGSHPRWQQQLYRHPSQPTTTTAMRYPTLASELEEVAEQAAREAACFQASAGIGRSSLIESGSVEPDTVRRFLLWHGRKPPQPAARAPPQRAEQQLQLIKEQLLEQHRLLCARNEQKAQNRILATSSQHRSLGSIIHGSVPDTHHLRLEVQHEQERRQQKLDLNELKENLELQLLTSIAAEEHARLGSDRLACEGEVQQQPPTPTFSERQRAQTQQAMLSEQLQQLALLGSIDSLFERHVPDSPPNGSTGSEEDGDSFVLPSSSSLQQHQRGKNTQRVRSPTLSDKCDN